MPPAGCEWEAELRALALATPQPCLLVACDQHEGQDARGAAVRVLRERIVCSNAPWREVCQYEEDDVADRSFSAIAGFQGPLTDEASKLRLASLLVSEQRLVEDIQVVNYTGKTKEPLEITLRVDIFKQQGRNAFFLCSIVRHRAVPLVAPEQPPTQRCQAVRDSWQAKLAGSVAASEEPCLLVLAQRRLECQDKPWASPAQAQVLVLREIIACASPAWCELCQYKAPEVVGKAFSSVQGLQGPLTTDESKLRLASLLVAEGSIVEDVRVVNYTGHLRQPIQFRLRVRVFRRQGWNEAFVCEVVDHRPIWEDSACVGEVLSRQTSTALEDCFLGSDTWSRQSTVATHADLETEGAQRDGMGPLAESPSEGMRRRRACACQA